MFITILDENGFPVREVEFPTTKGELLAEAKQVGADVKPQWGMRSIALAIGFAKNKAKV